MDAIEIREKLKEMYGGENKPITDGNYDQSLAVKCINGTFVGRKTEILFLMTASMRPITMRRAATAIRRLK